MAKLKDTQVNGTLHVTGSAFSSGGKILDVSCMKRLFGEQGMSMTTLYSGSAGSGSITLSSAATNFDAIVVVVASDSTTGWHYTFSPLWELKHLYNVSTNDLVVARGSIYWSITKASLSSTTWAPGTYSENSIIKYVYGINYNDANFGG